MTNAKPRMQPVMDAKISSRINDHSKLSTDSNPSVRARMNSAGTLNMMPDEAPFTAEAIVWLILFSTILVGKWEHTAFSHQLFLGVIALLLLASVFKLFLSIQKSVVQTRKLLVVVVVMFLLKTMEALLR